MYLPIIIFCCPFVRCSTLYLYWNTRVTPSTLYCFLISFFCKCYLLFVKYLFIFFHFPLWNLPSLLIASLETSPPKALGSKILPSEDHPVVHPEFGGPKVLPLYSLDTFIISLSILYYNHLYISFPNYIFWFIQLLNTQPLILCIFHSGCSINVCGMNK